MTVETVLYAALSPLVSGRVYPMIAAPNCARPFITYQQVGGRSVSFLESGVVGKRNGRFQFNVWSDDFQEAMTLMRSLADLIVDHPTLRAYALGEAIARYEDEVLLFGAESDFSIWF